LFYLLTNFDRSKGQRRAAAAAADSAAAAERLERDQEAVRERLEKLIGTLEAAERKA